MKILVLGNNEIILELRNQGHQITLDPGEVVDAVIATSNTYRLAPDNVPLFILLLGGLNDWAAKREKPAANFYVDPNELTKELNAKICEVKTDSLPVNKKESLIITVYSNKGGVGKTTSAISIATMLAEQGAKTVLVDFDYGGANLASFYNINKKFNNYLSDSNIIDSALFKVRRDLYLLPAPSDVVPNQTQPNEVTRTLQKLQSMFQIIVIDTPPSPWEKPYIHTIFSKADIVYAIVNQGKFSVEETRTYGPQLLVMGAATERIRIILNGYNSRLTAPCKVEEAFSEGFKKNVKYLPKISAIIPHDYEENMVALQKGTVINQDIWQQVAHEAIGMLSGDIQQEKQKGFLASFKRRFSR